MMIVPKKYVPSLLIFLFLFVFHSAAYSLNIKGLKIGLKAGYNYTIPIYSMTDLTHKPVIIYKAKNQVGSSNEVLINNNISIVAEIFYEKRFSYVSKINSYGPEIYPYAFKLNYQLLSFPILLKIQPEFILHPYFLIGLRFEYIFKAEEDFADCGGFYRHEDVSEKMPGFTSGIEFGIGKEISVWKIIIMPEIRYTLELRSAPPDDYNYPILRNIFTNHSFLINVGMAYNFVWIDNK